jgi:energy-coupling factor transport system substrate-specific component
MKNKALTWLIVLVVFIALMVIASLLTGPEGGRLSGVTWIIFTLIAVVIIYAIYFATAANEAWVVGTREVVYMAIGAALFGVLTWWANTLALPSVSLVSLRPTVCLPLFFGFVFGPVVGFFTGAVGNIIGDFLTGWGVYPAWDIANGFMGFIPGLILLFANKRRGLNALTVAVGVLVIIAAAIILIKPVIPHPWTGEETDFGLWAWLFLIGGAVVIAGRFLLERAGVELAAVNIWGTLGIILGIGFASIADIWINGYSFFVAMVGEFAPAAGSNILNAMILTPILLAAYRAVQVRAGR